MIDRVLIDALKFKSKPLSLRWKEKIRSFPELKHYNALEDEMLISLIESIFPLLAGYLENGLDKSAFGGYFVRMGKSSVTHGFPLSETLYGLHLSQEIILKYMESEITMDGSVALYQAISVTAKIAGFFLLGCYYLNRGFQEGTIEKITANEKIPKELLIKYYKDDFFFKKED
ncbi:MAG: hypothetical protein LBG79_00495 [Spirochaetaceae bacterium]|jgi:hypothetical protein|nr:hypothetical protein [Spirochaetaceae bacterium]GMO23552.1 MAG: hypothetical protein Pg6A_10500 [Termitinemataceae bacterium]